MPKQTTEFELNNFTGRRKCLNGVKMERNDVDKLSDEFARNYIFSLYIYTHGNKPENKNYVSIVFDLRGLDRIKYLYSDKHRKFSAILCILSVVDIYRNLRFSQSFAIDMETACLLTSLPVTIDRFIRRRILLDSCDELLPGDTLTLRCDVVKFYSELAIESQTSADFCAHLLNAAQEESWFIQSENGSWRLDLRNAHSSLCTRLRQQSDFFECLFRSPCKEMEDGYMSIEEHEFHDFQKMLGYIRFGSLLHIRHDWEFLDMYELSCAYGVRDLEEICIAHFKQNLTSDNAIKILRVADSRGDADLRTLAFKKVLSNWEQRGHRLHRRPIGWETLCSEWPQLASELSCAARILNLEDGLSLSNLAAGQVLLNSKKVQDSSTWSIFAKKLPDLAKVILYFDSYTSILFKPVEQYKDHVLDYDFYR